MRHIKPAALTAVLAATFLCQTSCASETQDWLVGVWQKTQDEDRSPPDTIKFLPNGQFINYGPNCEEKVNPYFLHGGNVYLSIEIPGKGPVALVFKPSGDRKALTFTSPRTLNNAVYEQAPNPPCGGGS